MLKQNFKLILLTLFTFLYLLPAIRLEAKGTLVKIEYFTPVSFCPKNEETCSLTYFVLKNSNITIRIFNFLGKRVLEKRAGFFYEGKYEFVWDGRDSGHRIVPAGFYRCEILGAEYGYNITDRDYAIVLVTDTSNLFVPPNLSDRLVRIVQDLPLRISGFARQITEMETMGRLNWDKKEIQLDIRSRYGAWICDLRFFPYYDPAQPFNWGDFFEFLTGYHAESWSIEAGYHNYIEGYSDPLNLLADYRMGAQRISLFAKSELTRHLNMRGGFHHIINNNEYALESKGTYIIADGIRINGCTVNSLSQTYSNNVLGFWIEFSELKGTELSVEVAGSLTSTRPDTGFWSVQVPGVAGRAEIKYSFPQLNRDYGNLGVSCGIEAVQKDFISSYADLPNGNDNIGGEIGAEYQRYFGLAWLKNLKAEVKKGYFRNTDNTLVRQKFIPTLSFDSIEGLDCYVHYNYFGTEDISGGFPVPLSRVRSALAGLHYFRPDKKWDTSFAYATSSTVSDSRTEYTSTRLVCGYHFSFFFPYLGCEKIVKISRNNRDIDCYFWTPGFDWIILPGYKTRLSLQAGYVVDNLSPNNRITYYAGFQHYFFNRFSINFSYGSLTSIDSVPRFSTQFKIEF